MMGKGASIYFSFFCVCLFVCLFACLFVCLLSGFCPSPSLSAMVCESEGRKKEGRNK